jgi:uncharacterized membrane protein
MERLAGIAEDVRHTVHVSAGGSRTDHLVLFEIGGTRLSFRGGAPVAIKEGDDLVVVWEPGDKGFNTVLAFHNRTVDARDHDIYAGGCTGCGCSVVVLVILALVIAWDAVDQRDWAFALIAAVLAAVAIVTHLVGRRNDRATAEKRQQADALLDADSPAS